MIEVAEGLLAETLSMLRQCGGGRRECVVYWTGDLSRPETVDGLMHPEHVGRPDGYEVDPTWHNRAWVELAHLRRSIRAQIHTHPGRAFHSSTDDAFPVVQQAGFLSLVIPDLAVGPGLDGAYLCELDGHGHWRRRTVAEALRVR